MKYSLFLSDFITNLLVTAYEKHSTKKCFQHFFNMVTYRSVLETVTNRNKMVIGRVVTKKPNMFEKI